MGGGEITIPVLGLQRYISKELADFGTFWYPDRTVTIGAEKAENAQRRTVGHQFLVESAGIEPASANPPQQVLHT